MTTRQMIGPARAALAYGLFLDTAGTRSWGVTPFIYTANGVGGGAGQPITADRPMPEGSRSLLTFYTDIVTATVPY